MTTIRTTLTDNFDTEVKIQGARSQNSNDDIASVVFLNYDNDNSNYYRMAEIAMRDNYGAPSQNGYGNLIFKTNGNGTTTSNLTDRMVINMNGNIGVNVTQPNEKLTVNGNACISSNIYSSNVFASNIVYKNEPTFYPLGNTQVTQTTYTKTFSWIYNNSSESNIRQIKDIGVRSYIYNPPTNSNLSLSYNLRIFDSITNKTLSNKTFSNISPVLNFLNIGSNLEKNDTILELHTRVNNNSNVYVNIDGLIVRYIS